MTKGVVHFAPYTLISTRYVQGVVNFFPYTLISTRYVQGVVHFCVNMSAPIP